jgi:hypothetical protein
MFLLNRYEQAQVPAIRHNATHRVNQRKHHFVFDVTVCSQDQFYFFLLKTLGKTFGSFGR